MANVEKGMVMLLELAFEMRCTKLGDHGCFPFEFEEEEEGTNQRF